MHGIVRNVKRNLRKKKINNLCIFLSIASLVFLLDHVIKNYLRTHLSFESIPVIKNIFHITVVFNTGAAFGLFQGKTDFLIITGSVFVVIFFFLVRRERKKSLLFWISCGLIAGGALSNMADRIFLGFVVDYLDFRIWPVFNLSDTAITTGVLLLGWRSFLNKNDKRDKNPAEK
ncbi:MAG: signal peptidase II [Candidatus Omnitrophica bacterium]|nr:signal peptidase II [Candidatus Omnitrophota bacterium]MBD3268995.1 signal peptidase II [Candidatus Omnitrophota bacterium]